MTAFVRVCGPFGPHACAALKPATANDDYFQIVVGKVVAPGSSLAAWIGYARVSTQNQNLDRQLGALRAARCKTIFAEKATGKSVKGRAELEKAIDTLGTGDILVVAEWDRATRSMI